MEVQFALSWNGWSEYDLQSDAFEKTNLPFFYLEGGYIKHDILYVTVENYSTKQMWDDDFPQMNISLKQKLAYDLECF